MKVDRLVSIIMILLDKERVSAQKLANMFEVSLRTIYRDIDSIDMAGIPIRSISGVGGGFEIMPKYKVDKNVFSVKDLSSMLIALTNFSNIISENDLINAIAKVKSLIPTEKSKDIEVRTNQIHVDLSSWLYNENVQPYLEMIKKALENRKLLSFDYIDRYGNKTKRLAEPYQLVLKSSHWYWQGYCLKRSDFRLFRLSRMTNLKIDDKTFEMRDFPNPNLDFEDILATMQSKIQIRIHNSILDRVLEHCSSDHIRMYGSEYHIVDFPFIENDYYYDILLGFGNKCECIEPSHIRAEMKRKINDIAKIYET